jgi:hypothetical protein
MDAKTMDSVVFCLMHVDLRGKSYGTVRMNITAAKS